MEEKQDKGEQKNLQAYVTAVANLVDFLFHDYGAPWEQIHGLLQSAGLSDEEIAEYNLSDLEEGKKPVMEKMGVEVYSYVGKDKLSTLDQVILLKDLLDVMWNSVRLTGKGIEGEAVLYKTSDGEYKLDTQKHSFGQEILKMKVKTEDEHTEDADGYPIIKATLTDEPLTEGRKPKITKKPLKEGVRLVYNPREKKTVKEEVKLSFDGEPLPVDIKESNTHTKLRLLRHK
jgi:hypothetical protein